MGAQTAYSQDGGFETSAKQSKTPSLFLKTNYIAWGGAISNISAEIDICENLSFNLPLYYSAWNYLTAYTKLRTFAIQPELRYWFSNKDSSWYTGAHFGLAYYNFASGSRYRIQDHDGKSPALGGGLTVGYRLPLFGSEKWKVEFSIGVGAYSLHYDRFNNEQGGLLVDSIKRTYIGIDQLAVSFSYPIELKRKVAER